MSVDAVVVTGVGVNNHLSRELSCGRVHIAAVNVRGTVVIVGGRDTVAEDLGGHTIVVDGILSCKLMSHSASRDCNMRRSRNVGAGG